MFFKIWQWIVFSVAVSACGDSYKDNLVEFAKRVKREDFVSERKACAGKEKQPPTR